MSKTTEMILKIKDRLSEPRYWFKGALYEYSADLADHPYTTPACLLGAHLDTLTDRAAWFDQDGPYDVGALLVDVINADPANIAITEVILEQFPGRAIRGGEEYKTPWHVIPNFNDDIETTHEDIILVLEKAAINS